MMSASKVAELEARADAIIEGWRKAPRVARASVQPLETRRYVDGTALIRETRIHGIARICETLTDEQIQQVNEFAWGLATPSRLATPSPEGAS
jgi:hypothetical protein